jgi:Scavenger mRNA decapping enzyme (DcpS) N-terminal
VAHSLVLLGSCESNQAILLLKKTAFQEHQDYAVYFENLESIESNDIVSGLYYASENAYPRSLQYHVLKGWIHNERVDHDVKIDLICPATDVHIRKVHHFPYP